MRRVQWLAGVLAVACAAIFTASGVAAPPTPPGPPTPPPGLNSGPAAPVPPPFAPPAGADGASASAPMTLQCQRTPALDAAVAVNPPTSAAAVQALCKAHGKPLATASTAVRHRKAKARASISPGLCGNAGCAYIWLYNLHNSYAEAEYQADPSPNVGAVNGGALAFTRYTQSNNTTAGWTDKPAANCGRSFCGYRYIYPIGNTTNSWVNVYGSGTVFLGANIATWGPVTTWNYITHG